MVLSAIVTAGCGKEGKTRNEISLNGTWEIAVTDTLSAIPASFTAEVPVPGLINIVEPALEDQDTAYENKVYWYRRALPAADMNRDIVKLKINKARYHTRVWVNGQFAGENPYNFTPSLFDIKRFLKTDGTANELIIAVGCWNNLPDTVTNGWDFEKIRYIPGIYDDVKLIVSDYPLIQNVQVVPDIPGEKLRVVAELVAAKRGEANIKFTLRESHTISGVPTSAFTGSSRIRRGMDYHGIPIGLLSFIQDSGRCTGTVSDTASGSRPNAGTR
jgi:beta-galactosidase/beta-glucuronidase